MKRYCSIVLSTLLLTTSTVSSVLVRAQEQTKPEQQKPPMQDCPMMQKHDMSGLNERREKGMGFSQEKTTHHFYLTKQGGVIQVEASDANDVSSREQIRQHLGHIAMMFTDGDFEIPMFVHDKTPDGVPEMKTLKSAISYRYAQTDRGGRVLISSNNVQAIAAIHSFLRFQIAEHRTGDNLETP